MAGSVSLGLDQFLQSPERWLRGRRFGLVTCAAARDSGGEPGFSRILATYPALLAALFAPEHGLLGDVADAVDVPPAKLGPGLPVFSLYEGGRYAPTPEMLAGLELLVIDLPDIGSRFYTFAATMVECLSAAAAAGVPVLVLDRPNPLGGSLVEGPGVTAGYRSFFAPLATPIVHGLTMAELARLAVAELNLPPDLLSWLPLRGWNANRDWDATGLVWYPTSPAATSPDMAAVYPGTCLFEGTNVSEGRGTSAPFELIGAPWIDGERLARAVAVDAAALGWPAPAPASFIPAEGRYAGVLCGGLRFRAARGHVASPGGVLSLAAAALVRLRGLYPEWFAWTGPDPGLGEPRRHIDLLAGGPALREAVDRRAHWQEIASSWQEAETEFIERSESSLLYSRPRLSGSARRPNAHLAADRVRGSVGNRCLPPAPDSAMVTGPGLDQMEGAAVARLLVDAAADAVAVTRPVVGRLSEAIEAAASRFSAGGRLIYVGAGTSGRLGVLDASECVPTFGIPAARVLAIIAGGDAALKASVEGAEDDAPAGREAMAAAGVNCLDTVVGIAASGSTPYTVAALAEAGLRGALTIALTSVPGTPLAGVADIAIAPATGEEPVRGSTRLKAGTAQKVVLNALSTGIFARLGYVYGQLMVGVQPANAKLRARAVAIVAAAAGSTKEAAAAAIERALAVDRRLAVRIAILDLLTGQGPRPAAALLAAAGESLRGAIALHTAKDGHRP